MKLRDFLAELQDVANSGYGDSELLFRTNEEECKGETIDIKASHNGAEGIVEVWLI